MNEKDFQDTVEAIEKANWIKIGFKLGFGLFLFSLLAGVIAAIFWFGILFK